MELSSQLYMLITLPPRKVLGVHWAATWVKPEPVVNSTVFTPHPHPTHSLTKIES